MGCVLCCAHVRELIAGEWLHEGKDDEPCAIFQHGRVLPFVNEKDDFATGRMTEDKKLTVKGWGDLVGEIADEGKKITWRDGFGALRALIKYRFTRLDR